jgi:Family of unknown function (DUF6356)
MSAWSRLFTEHPESVGESYWQHLAAAMSFGLRMLWGGVLCLVHAVIPGLCRTRGSEMICELHERMVTNRRRLAESGATVMEARKAA